MTPAHAFTVIILIWLSLITVALVMTPGLVFGEHKEGMEAKYIEHPTHRWFNERHEIHIVEVWIQPEQIYDPWTAVCIEGYELAPDGSCTLAEYHYWVYSLYLVQEMPSACDVRAIGCIVEDGIYILNGKQGATPSDGGCSVLYHEILHLKWKWMSTLKDNDAAHKRMFLEYPNEECSVDRRL